MRAGRGGVAVAAAAVLAGGVALAPAAPAAPPEPVHVAPGPRGHVGAFLLAGPFRAGKGAPPLPSEADLERASRGAKIGAGAWVVGSSGDGPIDVKAALSARDPDVVGYAAATLRIPTAGRHHLLLGVDDGVEVHVDGRTVFTREESRPFREDDDVVPLDLGKGDHRLLLVLHQRDGAWLFRARIVGADFKRAPGAELILPGTGDDDARALARSMSWVSVDRGGAQGGGYEPSVTVRFPEGAPLGVPLPVRARLARGAETLLDVDAGLAPTPDRGDAWVVRMPRIPPAEADRFAPKEKLEIVVDVAGRAVRAPMLALAETRAALAEARAVIARGEPAGLRPGTFASLELLTSRLGTLASRGDADDEAQASEAKELLEIARAVGAGRDPYESRTGFMRRAYRSPLDGAPAEYGLYVPRSWAPGRARRWPLVVALHGYDGRPLAMLRWFFGADEPQKEQPWEERHLAGIGDLDAFVLAPSGHGNAMYRDLGEDDVMSALAHVRELYPIDDARVTVTGPSMGGIGSAAAALRHPDVFAAAAPLCGYHSYFVRRDVKDKPIRPWERFLMEERSNVLWADNGATVPLWIVHGTRDLPVANSQVLIDRYGELGFRVKHDHPDRGHDVWQWTYEGLKGARWLLGQVRPPPPPRVRFRAPRPRWGAAWGARILAHERTDAWAEIGVDRTKTPITVRTDNVAEIALDPAAFVGAREIAVDGATFPLEPGKPLSLVRDKGAMRIATDEDRAAPRKRGARTGPIRDAFHEPLVFVWGASDPRDAVVNEEVARTWARIRPGVTITYPVLSDLEAEAKPAAFFAGKSVFLVGRPATNRALAAIEARLPIRVDDRGVALGARRVDGEELGAAFVHPHPDRPDTYVVVVAGVSARATLRSLSLPDLLPDFVVWDEAVAPARGQQLLGAGVVRAGGFFGPRWELPGGGDEAATRDPAIDPKKTARPRTEYEATPYLP